MSTTLLPALRGANSTRIPVELADALEHVAKEVGGEQLSVVVYAASAYNYSIEDYGDPLADLAPFIAPFAPPPPSISRFLFLSLPELERDSATLHAIALGHEIGHLRDWVHQITERLNVTAPPPWLDPFGDPLPARVDAVPFFRAIVAAWAQELVSDVFAALTLGPASLLSLLELLTGLTTFNADSPTHPAGDRRAQVILGVLDDSGFAGVPDLVPVLADVRQHVAGSDVRPVQLSGHSDRGPAIQEAADAAWWWLQAELPGLVASCRAVVPTIYDATTWPDAAWAAAQLDRGQPCGERVRLTPAGPGLEAVDPASVMNGAWLSKVRRHPGLASLLHAGTMASETAQLHAVVDGLVLKSLEISALRAGTAWA